MSGAGLSLLADLTRRDRAAQDKMGSSFSRRSNGLVSVNRGFKFYKPGQLFIRAHVSVQLLRDQTQRELVYRPFQFHERSQQFIRSHNVTLSVAAMCISNPDRSAC